MIIETLLLSLIILSDTTATEPQHLDEVVVVSKGQGGRRSAKGQVASIDEHLKELKNVSLVRRGSYAWEPVVNNMAMERVSTTIDGMKIFYACTDKMDPVTSYVESSNLQSILLNSGLNGNPQATGNIGGSLDLKLRKAPLSHSTPMAVFSIVMPTTTRKAVAERSLSHNSRRLTPTIISVSVFHHRMPSRAPSSLTVPPMWVTLP